jgi:hypothetical protein
MSFKSFLSEIGHALGVGLKDTFTFLSSAQGQAAVSGVEKAAAIGVGIVDPAAATVLIGIEGLFNAGLKEIMTVEASAAAAGMQSGTGVQKSAAVVGAIGPNVTAFLQSIGISQPTADQTQTVATALSDGIIKVLNSIPPRATAPAA